MPAMISPWLFFACAPTRGTLPERGPGIELRAPVGDTDAPGLNGPPTPYGFWGLNGYQSVESLRDLNQRLELTIFQTASEDPRWPVGTLLPRAREAGVKVTLRFTGYHEHYVNGDDFDLAAWKAMLAPWADAGLQPFIDDGTLAGHMLLDDIVNFEGRDPDAADLDEMARYSKELLPGLMTYVRQKATGLPVPESGRYVHLDACVNQYEAMEGDVTTYAATEAARAEALGLGVINGLNIADGGDGSSGHDGYRPAHHAMSAAEIARYGAVLAAVPTMGMFLNWEYDGEEQWADGTIGASYFNEPELAAALAELGRSVARHPHVELLRDPGP